MTAVDLLVIVVTILISMTIHEATHAYVGYMLGDTTAAEGGRISLNPLHHIDPYMTLLLPVVTLVFFHVPVMAAKPVPFNPYRVKFGEFGAALIALSGPLANLALALVGSIIARLGSNNLLIYDVMATFVSLNVALFVFNLIPIPPLDGSRVLYAFAPEIIQDFMSRIERFGLMIIFILVLTGGFGGLLLNIDQTVTRALLP